MLLAQDHSEHVEVGAFADYFRLSDASPTRNFVGLGGRVAFAIRPSVQLEAEMAYDFKRSYSNTFTNGVTTELVNTHLRTLHGFFGPKLQTGSGPFRLFITGKVGFDNFSINNQNATTGFVNTVGLTNGTTSSLSTRVEDLKPLPAPLEFAPRLATTSISTAALTTICGSPSVRSCGSSHGPSQPRRDVSLLRLCPGSAKDAASKASGGLPPVIQYCPPQRPAEPGRIRSGSAVP